jgi:hypothetical protein
MIRWIALLLTLSTGGVLLAQSPPAQVGPGKPAAHPFVVTDRNSQRPIEGAEVRDSASGKVGVTNAAGTVVLDFVTPLRLRFPFAGVTVRRVGYRPLTLLVSLTDTSTLTGELEPASPTELPAVVSSEHYRLDLDPGTWGGFGVRCQSKLVSCVDSATMADRPSYRLQDFLFKQDGILPNCRASMGRRSDPTAGCLAQMHPATGGNVLCTPTYFVDGVVWTAMTGSAQAEVERAFGEGGAKGIEVYRSEQPRPLRFSGDPRCGAVVIWTK